MRIRMKWVKQLSKRRKPWLQVSDVTPLLIADWWWWRVCHRCHVCVIRSRRWCQAILLHSSPERAERSAVGRHRLGWTRKFREFGCDLIRTPHISDTAYFIEMTTYKIQARLACIWLSPKNAAAKRKLSTEINVKYYQFAYPSKHFLKSIDNSGNIRKMGDLKNDMKTNFLSFVIGGGIFCNGKMYISIFYRFPEIIA